MRTSGGRGKKAHTIEQGAVRYAVLTRYCGGPNKFNDGKMQLKNNFIIERFNGEPSA